MSGNFTDVREMSGISEKSGNCHVKNLVRENFFKTFLKIAPTGFLSLT